MEEEINGARRSGRRSLSRSLSRASRSMEDVFYSPQSSGRSSSRAVEDEEALKWAAIERLPTYDRMRKTLLQSFEVQHNGNGSKKVMHKEVDVRNLDLKQRQEFIDHIFRVAEEDNEKFLKKFRHRIDKVGINLPTVEVRFEQLTVDAECYIGDRALPTLPNAARNMMESALSFLGVGLAERTKLTILKNISGIIKPSRYICPSLIPGSSSSYLYDMKFIRILIMA
ncbi:hypothetical protein Leryth_021794 [Lithospermum erythrorhizon]|nr:hypothetical protein Leryth_021794 [Lithospermum erythrorhizon]